MPIENAAPRVFRSVVLASVVALAGAACGGAGADAGSEIVRRDSAGIEIVESRRPLWEEGEGWRLADAPSLDIGSVEGAEEEQLFRATDATTLPDGRIAVANSGSHEVRIYGADGAFLSAVGGEGDGPGEFQFLLSISRLGGDTLRGWDPSARRLSDLSAGAGFLGSTRVNDAEGQFSNYVGTLPDGRLVMNLTSLPEPESLEDGKLLERAGSYWIYSAAGEPVEEVATFPAGARITRVTTTDGTVTGMSIITPPFRVETQVEIVSDGLVAALPDRFELRVLDADAGLTRIVRYGETLLPVTGARIDEWVNQAPPERRADQRAWIADVPMPEHIPTVQALLVDREENAWIRQYSDVADMPSRWTVIDADGEWLGTVEMPPRFRPLEIGADYVLGHWTDELDVEHVRRFELRK